MGYYIPGSPEAPMTTSLPEDFAARVRRLPLPDQERALAYVRSLERAATPGPLLAIIESIPAEDLGRMTAAIDADCERIDASAW